MPVHLTEYGYFRSRPRGRSPSAAARAGPFKAWKIARRNPRVKSMLHYVFVTPPGGTNFDLSAVADQREAPRGRTRSFEALDAQAARKHQIARPGRWRAG